MTQNTGMTIETPQKQETAVKSRRTSSLSTHKHARKMATMGASKPIYANAIEWSMASLAVKLYNCSVP